MFSRGTNIGTSPWRIGMIFTRLKWRKQCGKEDVLITVQVGAGLQEWDVGCWALPVLLSKPEHHCCRLLLDLPGSSLPLVHPTNCDTHFHQTNIERNQDSIYSTFFQKEENYRGGRGQRAGERGWGGGACQWILSPCRTKSELFIIQSLEHLAGPPGAFLASLLPLLPQSACRFPHSSLPSNMPDVYSPVPLFMLSFCSKGPTFCPNQFKILRFGLTDTFPEKFFTAPSKLSIPSSVASWCKPPVSMSPCLSSNIPSGVMWPGIKLQLYHSEAAWIGGPSISLRLSFPHL